MTEGKETTGGTPQDQEVVQDPMKEETASEEVEPQVGGNSHAHLHAEKAQEDLHAIEKGTTLQEVEIEVIETSVARATFEYGKGAHRRIETLLGSLTKKLINYIHHQSDAF